MKHLFNLLICVLISTFSNAQIETTNWLYNLEGQTPIIPKIENQNNTTTLKILNLSRYFDENFLLGEHIKRAINKGELTIYQDKECKKAFSKTEAKATILEVKTDTIITFDAETFEEQMKVVRHEKLFYPTEKTVYELEQNWKYDKKQHQLTMNLEAIHVYFLEQYDNGEVADLTNRTYLFSIKNEDAKTVIPQKELQKMSVIWAKEFSYNGTFENEKLRKALLSKKHIENHKIIDNNRMDILTNNEIVKLTQKSAISIDTIITFDPETFEEEWTIVESKLYYDTEHITSFRIKQDFYFDTQTNTFKTRILAVAPLRKVYDEEGNFKYQYPIFWVVYEDDFMKTLD